MVTDLVPCDTPFSPAATALQSSSVPSTLRRPVMTINANEELTDLVPSDNTAFSPSATACRSSGEPSTYSRGERLMGFNNTDAGMSMAAVGIVVLAAIAVAVAEDVSVVDSSVSVVAGLTAVVNVSVVDVLVVDVPVVDVPVVSVLVVREVVLVMVGHDPSPG